jgi:hypothetical protein
MARGTRPVPCRDQRQPTIASHFTFASQHRVSGSDPRSRPVVQLNAVTSPIFPGIGRSPVPVLLPFDTASYLEARQSGTPDTLSVSRFQSDFRPADLFHAGPAGYDAVFSLEPGAGEGMPQRTFAHPVQVQISGSILIYDLSDRLGGKGEPVKALAAQFPICAASSAKALCATPSPASASPMLSRSTALTARRDRAGWRAGGLSRRRAFPESLAHRRGQPTRPRTDILSGMAERPTASAPDFTYRPSGDIVANSGARKQGGHADLTAHSQIRFPLEKTPAFAHSQSFGKGKSDERTEEYPWRDNFCEARSFEVGQCASGFGHQGQDLRAAACPPNNDGGQNCDPKQQGDRRGPRRHRDPRGESRAATLQINTRTEHIRFRYMHMNPSAMDADGLLNGRSVAEGKRSALSQLPRPPRGHAAAICISTSRCLRATAGCGSIPTRR